uniref:Uncharacterized protein n=1 Tax=Anopheles melas TaxID=34690 RepID=A0A182UEF4_9DIPT
MLKEKMEVKSKKSYLTDDPKHAALLPVLREKLRTLQSSDPAATPPLSPSPPPPSLYFESSSISSRSSIVEPFDLNVASLYQVFHVKITSFPMKACTKEQLHDATKH